jgi:DNA ligase-1
MRSLREVYERVQNIPFVAEFKYDGQRAQIHAWRNIANLTVKIFSRHLEDMTDKASCGLTLYLLQLIYE